MHIIRTGATITNFKERIIVVCVITGEKQRHKRSRFFGIGPEKVDIIPLQARARVRVRVCGLLQKQMKTDLIFAHIFRAVA